MGRLSPLHEKEVLVHHGPGHQASGEPDEAPCAFPARGEVSCAAGGTSGSASMELCVSTHWCLPRHEVPEGPTVLEREECVVGRSGDLKERPRKEGVLRRKIQLASSERLQASFHPQARWRALVAR